MTEEAIFLVAIDILDAKARSRYLDEACGGDSSLRRQLDALLTAHEKSGDFLDVPAGEQLRPDTPHSRGAISKFATSQADESTESLRRSILSAGTLSLVANRFRVLEEIGHGGMGVVYRVADTFLGNGEVALKVIRRGSLLRFQEEFRAMTRLRHPNLVEVYDFGAFDGTTQFFTMELVRGRSLSSIKADRPPLTFVYQLLIQLLQALEFIHSRRYLHRDIKPGNIFVREDGILKLLDFGLMQPLGVLSDGTVTGTSAYMAPEVLRGETLGIPSDLYSVGCLAYELLAGRPPFTGTEINVLFKHLDDPPPPLRGARPDVPLQLEAIIARLLAKAPKQRYQSSAEVVTDLADLAGINVTRQNLDQKQSYLISSTLVGRDAELCQLQSALAAADAGAGCGVLVSAPAGIGKSRLSHELIVQAKLKGVTVVQARGTEAGMAPFELTVATLRPLLAISTESELERFGPLLGWLYPELRDRGIEPLPSSGASADTSRLFEAIAKWLRSVSFRNPLLVFVDDLHWCDPQSLEALNACIRLAPEARLLLLGTFRDDEVSPGSPVWRTIHEGKARHVKLAPFGIDQLRALLGSMLGSAGSGDEFAKSLFDVTGGNAFFVTEVLRDLIEAGLAIVSEGRWHFPNDAAGLATVENVDATVARRLGRVSPAALALAGAASVLGRQQSFEALAAVSGRTGEEFFRPLDELVDRQFVFQKEEGYHFTHDRVREALYRSLTPDIRQEMHFKCGEYLEALGRTDLVNELAYHFGRSNHLLKAYTYARRAGDHAKSVGSEEQALQYWYDAARWLSSCDVPDKDERLFELWWLVGENGIVLWPERGVESIKRCLERLEKRGNARRICAGLKVVASVIRWLPSRLREPLLKALSKPHPYQHAARTGSWKHLPPHVPSWAPKVIEGYVLACVASGLAGEAVEGKRLGERAIALLPFSDTPLEGCVLTALCGPLQAAGHFDELGRRVARARALLFDRDLSGQDIALSARVGAAAFSNLSVFQGYRFEPRWVNYCLWAAEQIQKPDFFNQAWVNPAIWYAWTGRHDEAAELIEKIAHNCRKIGASPFPWILYLRPYLAWQRGAFEEALAQTSQALRYPHLERLRLAYESVWVLKGHVHLSLGDPAGADAAFVAVEERARVRGMELVVVQARIGRGQVALHRGDITGARAFLEAALRSSQVGPARNPLHVALASRHLGEMARASGDNATATAHFDRALEIVRSADQDNLIEQGYLHLARGALARSQGNLVAAHDELERATSCFQQIGNAHCLRLMAKCKT